MEAFISRFKISPRELGIILEILADRTIREIADRLCISELTVKSHITHIYTKTGCVSRIKLLELLREYQISP
jgi:DNA-binding CsgD family transcriptional regulator